MFRSALSRRRALAFIASTLVTAGILTSVTSGAVAQESATPIPIGLVQTTEDLPE